MAETGNYFAIGKQQWNAACDLGLNTAVSFIVLARGSAVDNASTTWSMNSIETYGGITWRRARDEVQKLTEGNLLKKIKDGARPKYRISRPESIDDLIWLPNELVTGAASETPPIARLRQTGEVDALRVFVELYAEHDLVGDGGVARDLLYQHYARTKIMDIAQYTVFGFQRTEGRVVNRQRMFSRYAGKDGVAWEHLALIEKVGLIDWVVYLAESDRPYAELIHAISGDEWAQRVADEIRWFADDLPGGYKYAGEGYDFVLPVMSHLSNVAVVGVARLRYRPKTSKTSTWLAKHIETCTKFAETYELIRSGAYQNAA